MSTGSGRIAVVAGVFLDRAWPDLGPIAGRERREQTLPALLAAVRVAREQQAHALVVLGGLASRTTVMPTTLQDAWRALQAFDGPVVVVPGPDDWWDDQSPYALMPPPSNVTIATNRDQRVEAAGLAFAVSAVTSPGGTATFPRSAAGDATVIALPTWIDRLPSVGSSAGLVLVATDGPPDEDSSAVFVRNLCGGGDATLFMIDVATGLAEGHVVAHVDEQVDVLDVSDCADSSSLQELIDERARAGFSGRLQLVGALPSGVLLPDTTDYDGWLDLHDLEYVLDDPDPRDQSARAEFVRGLVADVEPPPRVRHQAIAHGLAAFAAEDD